MSSSALLPFRAARFRDDLGNYVKDVAGHEQVEDHNVRTQLFVYLKSIIGSCSLGDDPEIVIYLKEIDHARQQKRMVVDQRDRY
jgi:hypothetical protein